MTELVTLALMGIGAVLGGLLVWLTSFLGRRRLAPAEPCSSRDLPREVSSDSKKASARRSGAETARVGG